MQTRFPRLYPLVVYVERVPVSAFLFVLLVGFALRLIMLPTAGFPLDLVQFYDWGRCATQNGVFGLYQCQTLVTHPPLSPAMLGFSLSILHALGGDISTFEGNAPVVIALKFSTLVFETALFSLVFYIIYKKAGVWWAAFLSALLYWNMGWAVVTAWWGQNDAVYSFFMLVVVYLLTRNRPRWMWLAYGCAMLAKFQSVMFLPILGVLSLRRFGWRATLEGGVIGVVLFALVILPFYLGSGILAFKPFGGTVNLFPYITTGAHNFWFWASGASHIALEDNLPLIGDVTYFQVGFVLLAIGTAVLCLRAWITKGRGEEYLLFAAANFTFYMLPTQIQVRYLYPGLMFLTLAMIRDWRLIILYIVAALAFTHNVFATVWLGIGMLFYPAKLLFWQPVHDGIAMTIFYLIFMLLVFTQRYSRSRPRARPLRAAGQRR